MDEKQEATIFGQEENKEQEPKLEAPIQQVQGRQENNPLENLEEEESFFSRYFPKAIKIFIAIIIVALFVFLIIRFILPRFAAKEDKIVTLKYWGLWEDKNTMQSIINDFEKENPNVKIEYSKQDIKQYRQRLVTRIENGEGPDIFRFHNTWVIQLYDILLPLSKETITKEEFKKSFYPVAQSDLIKNGAIYGIPLEIDTLSLFTNSEMFSVAGAKVPKTWEDFVKTAKSLTVKDEEGRIKTAGAALGTFDNISHAPDIVSLFLLQNGANLEKLLQTPQNSQDALIFYTSFAKEEDNVWDNTLDNSLLAFSKGNLAMYFGYSWDVFNFKAINSALLFEVHPVPKLEGRNITVASYWVEGISAKTKYQEETSLFLKYLAKKETQQKLFTETAKSRFFGEPYSRADLAETLKNNVLAYPFVEDGPNALSSFFVSNTFDDGLNSQMNNYLGNAIRSILGNTSPDSAVETLSQGVDQVLGQYDKNKQITN